MTFLNLPTERINAKPTPHVGAVWMWNDSGVLNIQELWASVQNRSVESKTFYTHVCVYIYIRTHAHTHTEYYTPKAVATALVCLASPCNVINSNNIRLVSSNYIHSPPRESLINPYYNVTFARNLLPTWTHIHRAALHYTGWCTTHWNYTRYELYSGDGQKSHKIAGMTAQRVSTVSLPPYYPRVCYNRPNKLAAGKDYFLTHRALVEC